jgi:hypothetical protein
LREYRRSSASIPSFFSSTSNIDFPWIWRALWFGHGAEKGMGCFPAMLAMKPWLYQEPASALLFSAWLPDRRLSHHKLDTHETPVVGSNMSGHETWRSIFVEPS